MKENLAMIIFDAAVAGLDRLLIQQAVRDGEAAGKTDDEITDAVIAIMKAHGIDAQKSINDIPG